MTEQMKSSGIGWIKDIPSSWEITKVKYLATEPGTLFLDGDWIESDVIEESGIRYLTTGNVGAGFYKEQGCGYISEKTFSELHCLNVYPGDLMISRLNEPIGRACIIPDTESRYVVAVDNVILRPNANYNKKFIMYGMNADGYAEHANMIARGATMSRISRSQLGQFWLAFPNIEEQQAIADFLDKECAQIDSIAADLEKQIALLQQYKKSLITETVTKGLDKSAPMKDSGVEWIGKIPEHWQKTRIKFEASIIGSGTTPDSGNSMYYDNGEHSWIQSGDLYGKDYIYETEKQLTNLAILECHALNWYTKDFVVVAMYGASVGNVAISKIDSFTNQACCVIKLNEKNDNRYLFYFLKAAQEEMLLKAFGGTQPNISQIIIKNLNFLNVPLLEQIEIADFLDSKCDMINEMLKSKKDQYDILIKHKKSLIYEYVTGKKRVKEVQ